MVFIRKVTSRGCVYAQLVRTERVNGKVQTKVIKHIGPWKSLTEKLLEPTYECDFVSCAYGDVYVLFRISKELNLIEIINNHTTKGGGVNVGELSLIIVINHCVDPTSKLKMGKWFARTYLPKLLNISPDKANKNSLTRVLDYLKEKETTKIEKSIFETLQIIFNLKKEFLLYDITSTYVYGNKCSFAKYGYNRDHVPEKQINFGLVLSREEKFPITHRTFKGNVTDVTTVCSTTDKIKEEFDINTCMLVIDRGMASEDNLIYLDEKHFGYIVALPKGWTLTQDIILEAKNFNLIENETYAIESIKVHNEKKKKFVVFLNKGKQKEDKGKREKLIEKTKQKLDKLKEKILKRKIKDRDKVVMGVGEILKGVKKYFQIKHDKKELMFNYSLNQMILQKEEALDGKYVVCCTDIKMSEREILLAYRDKDKAEKAFKCIKCFIEVRPIRHWKDERPLAHIFLCILAYLLKKVLEYKYKLKKQKDEPCTSAEEILNELAGIKMISYKIKGQTIDKLTTINEKQKKIIKKLGYWPFK